MELFTYYAVLIYWWYIAEREEGRRERRVKSNIGVGWKMQELISFIVGNDGWMSEVQKLYNRRLDGMLLPIMI